MMKSSSTKEEQKKLFREWKQHLSNSRLSEQQQTKRAKEFSRKGMKPND